MWLFKPLECYLSFLQMPSCPFLVPSTLIFCHIQVISFCLWPTEFHLGCSYDRSLEITTGAYWAQQWAHIWKQWLPRSQNLSVRSISSGPMSLFPVYYWLWTGLVLWRPRASSCSCCEFLMKIAKSFLENGILPFSPDLLAPTFCRYSLLRWFQSPSWSKTNELLRDESPSTVASSQNLGQPWVSSFAVIHGKDRLLSLGQ